MNMFRVKPRANLGLIFFTVLIQKDEKQWKVLSGSLKNLPSGIPSGHQTFPWGCAPRESLMTLGNSLVQNLISRQPLRTYHCLYQTVYLVAVVLCCGRASCRTGRYSDAASSSEHLKEVGFACLGCANPLPAARGKSV